MTPAKKMRVEVFDGGGNKYTITFEGNVTRDKAVHLLDLVELLGGVPSTNPTGESAATESSKFDKVRLILRRNFPIVWFSSKDVQTVYEQELKEPLGLSTVSTYLSRMAERGILMKSGSANSKRYRLMSHAMQSTLNLTKDNK